ncbi:MAG: hypothetical protein PHY99_06240 [Bacteroidales bacterium]|nr:hypothetical protein [Bacteroidales bacterium]
MDAATSTYLPHNNAVLEAIDIPSSQVFMVRANATDNVSFTRAKRNHGTAAFKSGDSRHSIKLNANIADQNKSTQITCINDATEGMYAAFTAAASMVLLNPKKR